MRTFRSLYGRDRLSHLPAMMLTYAITGYAVWAMFQNPRPWTILLWLALAIVVHDFVFLPLYTAAYRLARRVGGAGEVRRRRVVALQHLAVPAMVSVLVFLAALPSILSLSPGYTATTGMTQDPYLERWLWFTAALFALSAVVYLVRVRRLSRS